MIFYFKLDYVYEFRNRVNTNPIQNQVCGKLFNIVQELFTAEIPSSVICSQPKMLSITRFSLYLAIAYIPSFVIFGMPLISIFWRSWQRWTKCIIPLSVITWQNLTVLPWLSYNHQLNRYCFVHVCMCAWLYFFKHFFCVSWVINWTWSQIAGLLVGTSTTSYYYVHLVCCSNTSQTNWKTLTRNFWT